MPGCQLLRVIAADAGGVTAIEYALIASLIAIAAVAVYVAIGAHLTTIFMNVSRDF